MLFDSSVNPNANQELWKTSLRGGRTVVTQVQQLIPLIVDWVKTHPNVIPSPQICDTLLINGVRKEKLLLEISVHELHNSMIQSVADGGLAKAQNSDGKVIVSDSSLRLILKTKIPKLRKATDSHKQMCGCEICVVSRMMFSSLNAWRQKQVKLLDANAITHSERFEARRYSNFVNTAPTKTSDAIKEVMCSPVTECNNHFKWNCVL